jgi:hypothetical protein
VRLPVVYRLKYSVFQRLFISGSHVLALWVVTYTNLPTALQLALSLAVTVSWGYELLRVLGRAGGYKVDALRYAQNSIVCYAKSEMVFTGLLLPGSIVTPLFILLFLHDDSLRRKRHLLICCDQLTKSEFRQLSVELRLSQ